MDGQDSNFKGHAAPDCAACPFRDAESGRPKHKPVLAAVPRDPIGLLVGEGPSQEDVETGRPFSGPVGRQLDEELLDAGINRERLVVILAAACRAPSDDARENYRDAVRCCAPLFRSQLKGYPPNIPTLACGRWAAFALLGKDKGVMSTRGFVRDFKLGNESDES